MLGKILIYIHNFYFNLESHWSLVVGTSNLMKGWGCLNSKGVPIVK